MGTLDDPQHDPPIGIPCVFTAIFPPTPHLKAMVLDILVVRIFYAGDRRDILQRQSTSCRGNPSFLKDLAAHMPKLLFACLQKAVFTSCDASPPARYALWRQSAGGGISRLSAIGGHPDQEEIVDVVPPSVHHFADGTVIPPLELELLAPRVHDCESAPHGKLHCMQWGNMTRLCLRMKQTWYVLSVYV